MEQFISNMDSISDFIFQVITDLWSLITDNVLLFASFSLFLVSLVFYFFRKLRNIK